MPTQTETDIIPPPQAETSPNRRQMSHKTRKAIDLVLEHGVEPKDAMILTQCVKTVNGENISRFKAKVQKYSLQRPVMQKLAQQAVKDVLEGKVVEYASEKAIAGIGVVEFTERVAPTYTNKLAAAAMVYERTEPVLRQNVNVNLNVDVDPFDLSKYRR
jgi:hypothetical protein